jgi:hypothetical protein
LWQNAEMTLTFAELRKQLDDAEKELAAASKLEQKRRAVRKIRRLMRLAEDLLQEKQDPPRYIN